MKNNCSASVEKVIDNIIQFVNEKNLPGTLLQYDDSEQFTFINDKGQVLKSKAFAEMFAVAFENLEYIDVYESQVSVKQLGADYALCIWQGKEKIKMKGMDEADTSWILTLVLRNTGEAWKIIHHHVTHI